MRHSIRENILLIRKLEKMVIKVQTCEKPCVEWSVVAPRIGNGISSEYFELCNYYWYLRLVTSWDESAHDENWRMLLVKKRQQTMPPNFLITAHVKGYCTTTYLAHKEITEYSTEIWNCNYHSLIKPLSYIENDSITFICTFDLYINLKNFKASSKIERVLEDKSVQASCPTTSLSYSDDRHCLENLSLDLRKLLDDDSDPDVQLKCGDCTISAHRVILGVRSEVFRTMLQSDMVEGRKGSVDIIDMESDVLKIFIRYLYTGVLPELTKDTATPLYETGDKYHVEALKRRCSDFLVKNLTHENACGILAMADAHSDKDLKDRVMPYVLDEKIPKNDDEWTKFCDDHPKLAIEVLRQAYNHSFSSE